jgi:hypothetical protein
MASVATKKHLTNPFVIIFLPTAISGHSRLPHDDSAKWHRIHLHGTEKDQKQPQWILPPCNLRLMINAQQTFGSRKRGAIMIRL